MTIFHNLKQFRQRAYNLLGKAKDATFELMDAVILTKEVSSYPELSMCPAFRRGWSSIYEAIEDTRPNTSKLMKLYIHRTAFMCAQTINSRRSHPSTSTRSKNPV